MSQKPAALLAARELPVRSPGRPARVSKLTECGEVAAVSARSASHTLTSARAFGLTTVGVWHATIGVMTISLMGVVFTEIGYVSSSPLR